MESVLDLHRYTEKDFAYAKELFEGEMWFPMERYPFVRTDDYYAGDFVNFSKYKIPNGGFPVVRNPLGKKDIPITRPRSK
tara:strand:+ start:35558 stop:35797 length:240 start_codon:yes stop_codon:yes gene_type:complete